MKLLTLILMTLLFFTGCGSDNGEDGEPPTDEANADNADEVTGGEEEVVTAPSGNIEYTSTFITCSGNNTTYEIRRATSSCDRMESVCCGLYLTETGGSSTLISAPNLGPYQCNVFGSISRGGTYGAGYLAEGHIDKVSQHDGMNCIESTPQ